MLIDLHNHSIASYDGFTTEAEMLEACRVRGIDAIAVSEHDKLCSLSKQSFATHGIELIQGCEFTTDRGAHIIGLFVAEGLPVGSSAEAIVEHIKEQDGLAVMPHPWKPHSGYMSVHGESNILSQFDFIEMVNGGWNSANYRSQIIDLAERYDLLMISSSDSHRGCQVGMCVTKVNISEKFAIGSAKNALRSITQRDLELLIDKSMLTSKGRKPKPIQVTAAYQYLLLLVPKIIRRTLKILQYRLSQDSAARRPDFQVFRWTDND